jgi:hypothetical protein
METAPCPHRDSDISRSTVRPAMKTVHAVELGCDLASPSLEDSLADALSARLEAKGLACYTRPAPTHEWFTRRRGLVPRARERRNDAFDRRAAGTMKVKLDSGRGAGFQLQDYAHLDSVTPSRATAAQGRPRTG